MRPLADQSEANGGDPPPTKNPRPPGMIYGLRFLDLTKPLAQRNVWTLGLDGFLLYDSRGDWISFLFLYFLQFFLSSHLFRLIILFVSFLLYLLHRHRFGKRFVGFKIAENTSHLR